MKGEEILRNKLAQRHHIPARYYVSTGCHTLDNWKQTWFSFDRRQNPRWAFWCLFLLRTSNWNRWAITFPRIKARWTYILPTVVFVGNEGFRAADVCDCRLHHRCWVYHSIKTDRANSLGHLRNQIPHSSSIKHVPALRKSGRVGLMSARLQALSMTPQIHHAPVKREAFASMPPLLQPRLKSESVSKIRHIQMMKRSLVICVSHSLWASKEIATSRENAA